MRILSVLLEISVYSAVIFCLTMLLKLLFKNRMSPFLHYAVWAILLLRLMMPLTISSPVQFFTIPATQTQAAIAALNPEGQEADSAKDTQPGVPAAQQESAADAALTQQAEAASPDAVQTVQTVISLQSILLAVWLAGAVAGAAYLLVLYVRLRRRIAKSAVKPAKRLLQIYREVKDTLGIKAKVPLLCLHNCDSPGVLFPARILMPVETLVALDERQIRNVLTHELIHYRRRDHVVCILLSILNVVYWFNPFVWLAVRQIRSDMETACDSAVVRRMNAGEKGNYASLVLELFSRARYRQVVLGMAHGGTASAAEQRIRGIFMNHNSKFGAKAACILLALVLVVGCFTNACVPKEDASVAIIGGADGPTSIWVADSSNADGAAAVSDHLILTDRTYYDGALTLNIDADISRSAAEQYTVYRMIDKPFTQEQVDRIANVLMQGNPLLSVPDAISKDMAYTLLEQAKDTLAKLEAGETVEVDGEIPTIEEARAAVEQWQQRYDSAPQTQTTTPATTESYSQDQSLLVYADLGQDSLAKLQILNYEPNCLRFSNGRTFLLDDNAGDDALPQGVTMTRSDAIALADRTLAALGVENMDLAFAGRSRRADGSEYEIDSAAYRNTQCHLLIYTRSIDGIPSIADRTATMLSGPSGEKNLAKYFERIYFAIDDLGIRQLEWRGQKELLEAVSVSAMPSLEALPQMELIAAAIETQYAYVQDDASIPIESIVIDVDRVELGYVACITADGSYLMKPMWDCFGTVTTQYDEAAIAAYNLENGTDRPARIVQSNLRNVICTIDAETGESYSKHLGMYAGEALS